MASRLSESRSLPDSEKFGDIEWRLLYVRDAVIKSGIQRKEECLVFIRRAESMWPSFKKFTPDKRQELADILDDARGTVEKGGPIWVQINEIIQLLLPPQFASLCNDILELWMHSSNESEALLDKVSMCVNAWAEGVRRGRHGTLEVQPMKHIFVVLLNVVHTVQKEPEMKKNKRLQYVVNFISDLRTELDMRTVTMTNPEAVFMYVKSAMTKYAPSYVPPVLDIGTVVEEDEEEEEEPATEAHPLRVGDDGLRGGDGNEIPMEADMSTLLRQMKQLCV